MSDPRIYRARADAGRARPLAETGSPFTITIRFGDGLTDAQRGAFAAAADRWVTVIVGDLPEVTAAVLRAPPVELHGDALTA